MRIEKGSSRIHSALLTLAAFALCASVAVAQPQLNFKRIVNNWPSIELYFSVACNGSPAYFGDANNLRVYENGIPVPSFTLWCPNPNQPLPVSVALALDASGSMAGAGSAAARQLSNALVDSLNVAGDRGGVLWFNSNITLAQGMTSDTNLLHAAVNTLPASGSSRVWDGAYDALQELVTNGLQNNSKALILMTDGDDVGSTRSPTEIISLANRNTIRIFTFALGSGAKIDVLQQFADLTGGAFYGTPTLAAIGDIVRILRAGNQECKITYQAQCMDGGFRRVDLSVVNFCGGQDTKTKMYKAPKDTSTYTNIRLRTGSVSTLGGDTVLVPVLLGDTLHGLMYNSTASFNYEPSVMQLVGAQAPAGTLLAGTWMTITPGVGAVTIQTLMSMPIVINNSSPSAPLYYLRFWVPGHFGKDTTQHPVQFLSCVFEAGCLRPQLSSGQMAIIGKNPRVYYDFLPAFCEGGSMLLRALPGVSSYRWSTGETKNFINVTAGGPYWYTAQDSLGQTLRSDTLLVTMRPTPKPLLTPSDTVWMCRNDAPVKISAGSTWHGYVWSDKSTGDAINVSMPGDYFVTVTDAFGCTGSSAPVYVRWRTLAAPAINGARTTCATSAESYEADSVAGRAYRWLISGGSIVGPNDQRRVRVAWASGVSGRVMLAINEGNCEAYASADVLLTGGPQPLISGVTTACEDNTMRYGVAPTVGHSYSWTVAGGSITGRADSSSVLVHWRTPGTGRVVLVETSPPCSGSDTLFVTVNAGAHPVITKIGSLPLCHGDSIALDAGPGYTSYRWSNGDSARIVIAHGTASYFVRVTRTGFCDGLSDTVLVTELPAPKKPAITQQGNTLRCDSAASYQWFASGTPISGATRRTLDIPISGRFFVRTVDFNGCTVYSDTIDAHYSGVSPLPPSEIALDWYPRPVKGDFVLRLGTLSSTTARLRITDLLGRVVYQRNLSAEQSASFVIPFSLPPAGVYLLSIESEGTLRVKTLVKAR